MLELPVEETSSDVITVLFKDVFVNIIKICLLLESREQAEMSILVEENSQLGKSFFFHMKWDVVEEIAVRLVKGCNQHISWLPRRSHERVNVCMFLYVVNDSPYVMKLPIRLTLPYALLPEGLLQTNIPLLDVTKVELNYILEGAKYHVENVHDVLPMLESQLLLAVPNGNHRVSDLSLVARMCLNDVKLADRFDQDSQNISFVPILIYISRYFTVDLAYFFDVLKSILLNGQKVHQIVEDVGSPNHNPLI